MVCACSCGACDIGDVRDIGGGSSGGGGGDCCVLTI
jgi:hypothetical protein